MQPLPHDDRTAREIHTEAQIRAPIEHVWAVLTDFAGYGEWNPWMTSVEGELRIGARLLVHVRLGDRTIGFSPRVIHVDPGVAFAWLGHTLLPRIFDGEHRFELAPQGEGTRLVHRERFGGLLAGPVLRRIGEATREGFEAMNAALVRRCETPPGSDPSSA